MVSIKANIIPMEGGAAMGTVNYQIICGGRAFMMPTAIVMPLAEWDTGRSLPALSASAADAGRRVRVCDDIRLGLDRLERTVRTLERGGIEFSAEDIAEAYGDYCRRYTLFNYVKTVANGLVTLGKTRTAETYASALSSIEKFREGKDVMLDALTADEVEAYEAWLLGRGVKRNTTSFYMRILRAAYNRAVDEGAIEDRRPFRHVYTGVDKTAKRALPLGMLRRMKRMKLAAGTAQAYSRDMFMLSFYLRGMSFIDMAYLRKSDLKGGVLTYRRRKTGQTLTIRWTADMQEIVDRYPKNTSDYLLPVIMGTVADERAAYRKMAYAVNRGLKSIASRIGVETPLTLYCARHSWASVAKAKGIPLSVISEGMGHESESTTRIYLATLEAAAVDRANALILASL